MKEKFRKPRPQPPKWFWADNDNCWDYPTCYVTGESCGYNFNILEKRMPNCPLKEIKEDNVQI